MSANKISWTDCGDGAHQSADRRFYVQVTRRYLGRRAGRPTYDVTAALLDRSTQGQSEHGNLRAAKEAAAALAV